MVLDGPLHLTRALIEPMVGNLYGRILFFCGDGSISATVAAARIYRPRRWG
jgi:hypothetical protein